GADRWNQGWGGKKMGARTGGGKAGGVVGHPGACVIPSGARDRLNGIGTPSRRSVAAGKSPRRCAPRDDVTVSPGMTGRRGPRDDNPQKNPGTAQPWSPVPYRLAAVMPQRYLVDLVAARYRATAKRPQNTVMSLA